MHGGGFRAGKRQEMLPMARKLAENGYVAAAISYRLTPRFQFPAPVHDAKAAVRFLRAHAARFALDAGHIGTAGASAGGTISLFLGVTRGFPEWEGPGPWREHSSAVNCVVNLYGRSDLTTSYGGSRNAAEVLPLLVGGELPWGRTAHLRASPLYWVTPSAAPVLAIHGTLDLNVPYQQSIQLDERLRAAGVATELETLQGAGHGFRGADAERADQRMIEFFDRHLKPTPDPGRIRLTTSEGERITLGWPSGRILKREPGEPPQRSMVQPPAVLTKGTGPLRLTSVSAAKARPDGSFLIADNGARRLIEVSAQGVPLREIRDLAFEVVAIEILP